MTVPVCSRCDRYIDHNNRATPGYCSAECRDQAVRDRARQRDGRARRRRDDEDALWS